LKCERGLREKQALMYQLLQFLEQQVLLFLVLQILLLQLRQ
jgi:hypothetical protein